MMLKPNCTSLVHRLLQQWSRNWTNISAWRNWEGCLFFEAQLTTVSKIDALGTQKSHIHSPSILSCPTARDLSRNDFGPGISPKTCKTSHEKTCVVVAPTEPMGFSRIALRPSKKKHTTGLFFGSSRFNWWIRKKTYHITGWSARSPLLITFRQRGVLVRLALGWPVLRWLMALGLSGRCHCPRSLTFVGINVSPPTQDASHHQDYYIFNRGSL